MKRCTGGACEAPATVSLTVNSGPFEGLSVDYCESCCFATVAVLLHEEDFALKPLGTAVAP